MEYLDVVDENTGEPTGAVVSRACAHDEGICHRTAHIWVTRERDGRHEVLLQRRSPEKESFPGLLDTSAAGHVPAGEEPLAAAVRELHEELGILASPYDLAFAGTFHIKYEKVFHGRPFKDNEVARVFVFDGEMDAETLTLQTTEVSEVRWLALDVVWRRVLAHDGEFCVPLGGLETLVRYLGPKDALRP